MAKPKQVNAANCRRPGPPPDAILAKPYEGLIPKEEEPTKGKGKKAAS